MNKPEVPPMLPGLPATKGPAATLPKALIHQPKPVNTATGRPPIRTTRPARPAEGTEYVDPYLFETGYYASQAEYEELSRTTASRIRSRAEVENAKPKRRIQA